MRAVTLRADIDAYADFERAANGQAAEITRQLWAWFARRPGAKLPARPAASDHETSTPA